VKRILDQWNIRDNSIHRTTITPLNDTSNRPNKIKTNDRTTTFLTLSAQIPGKTVDNSSVWRDSLMKDIQINPRGKSRVILIKEQKMRNIGVVKNNQGIPIPKGRTIVSSIGVTNPNQGKAVTPILQNEEENSSKDQATNPLTQINLIVQNMDTIKRKNFFRKI